MKCVRDGLTWNDDNFIPAIERHLGFRQQPQPQPQQRQPQPNGNGHAPASAPAPQRNGAQLRQQRPASAPVSAPPTRDAPSMSTGRPTSHRVPLTEAEAEIARSSGLSLEEYQQKKEKMLRLKAAGAVQ
jgi:hypothetical protein